MRYQFVRQLQGYSRQSVLMAGGCFLMGVLGWATPVLASVPTITYGTVISAGTYDPGLYNSYPTYTSYTTPGYFNYTNGVLSQSRTVLDSYSLYNYGYVFDSKASATASLLGNTLSLNLTGSTNGNNGGSTGGKAEMWDTLTFGNLPTGSSVNANTVLGTLNMTVNTSMTSQHMNAYGTYALSVYNPGTFNLLPISSTPDCGLTYSALRGLAGCTGVVAGDNVSAVVGNSVLSVPITLASLNNGQLAYIAEIVGVNQDYFSTNFVIDPSVTITGLSHGVTVTSLSGTNYVSTVKEPPTTVLLGGGALLMGLRAFRKKPVSAL